MDPLIQIEKCVRSHIQCFSFFFTLEFHIESNHSFFPSFSHLFFDYDSFFFFLSFFNSFIHISWFFILKHFCCLKSGGFYRTHKITLSHNLSLSLSLFLSLPLSLFPKLSLFTFSFVLSSGWLTRTKNELI